MLCPYRSMRPGMCVGAQRWGVAAQSKVGFYAAMVVALSHTGSEFRSVEITYFDRAEIEEGRAESGEGFRYM